jgi:hypothetical protein
VGAPSRSSDGYEEWNGITVPSNWLERRQNDVMMCKLELRGGGGGKVVREALHRSFYRGKSPGALQTTFQSLSQGNRRSIR